MLPLKLQASPVKQLQTTQEPSGPDHATLQLSLLPHLQTEPFQQADHAVPVPAVFFMTYVLLLVSTMQELPAACDVTGRPALCPSKWALVPRQAACAADDSIHAAPCQLPDAGASTRKYC